MNSTCKKSTTYPLSKADAVLNIVFYVAQLLKKTSEMALKIVFLPVVN